MQQAAESIDRRSAGLIDVAQGVVRLSAGEAMIDFIAPASAAAAAQPAMRGVRTCPPAIRWPTSRGREADLLIREQVPDLASIVTRKLGRAAYAIYARKGTKVRDTSPEALRKQVMAGLRRRSHLHAGPGLDAGAAGRAGGPRSGSMTGW